MYRYQALKQRHRAQRNTDNQNLSLRVHRALSWLDKAEQSEGDLDAQFIFLWIAFNSAYAHELSTIEHMNEKQCFHQFFERITQLDDDQELYNLVWREFSSSIRLLLNNPYVFSPFWQFHSGLISEKDWQHQFAKAKEAAHAALGHRDTIKVLNIIFSRLYTLRNQLIHGGATWQSKANRDQLRDGVAFLSKAVPIIINLMMDDGKAIWGTANYPVVVA